MNKNIFQKEIRTVFSVSGMENDFNGLFDKISIILGHDEFTLDMFPINDEGKKLNKQEPNEKRVFFYVSSV